MKPSGTTPATSDALEARAADWIARRNGGLDPAAQTELAAWLAADARHAAAFSAMEQAWSTLTAPRLTASPPAPQRTELETQRRIRAQRRRVVWSSLGVAASLALLSRVLPLPEPAAIAPAAAIHETRPTIRTLADGSKIALRLGAEIEVNFSAARRSVRLTRGEALFTVAKDPARPFVVSARGVDVRAVGTEFVVRHDPAAIAILVTEGRIAVGETSPVGVESVPIQASAGDSVVVQTDAIAPVVPRVVPVPAAEIARALAWRGRRLEFSETPLAEALALINREAPLSYTLEAPALGRRTITAVIWADDTESFVRLLETGFELQAERNGTVVRLHAK